MKRTSIAYKIFIGILALSVGFLSLMWVTIDKMYTNVLREKEVLYNVTVSNKTKEQFDFIIDLMNRTLNSLDKNHALNELLNATDLPASGEQNTEVFNSEDLIQKRQAVTTLLDNSLELQSFINSIHIIGVNDLLLSTTNAELNAESEEFYRLYLDSAILNDSKDGFWSGLHNIYTGTNQIVKVLSFIQPYYSNYSHKLLGVIIVNLDYDVMQEMFFATSIQLNDRAIIVDPSGEILFNYPHFVVFDTIFTEYPELLKQQSMRFNAKVFGKDNLIVSETINKSDLKIIRLIPTDSMTSDFNRIVFTTRKILLLCIIVCFIYALWLTKTITKPLKVLTDACSRIERSDLSARVKIDTPDEFGRLGNTFNIMMEQLNKHFDQELTEQKRKSEIQFQLLQAQINPHFLYNTLDSIKWMAVMQNVNNIAEMSTALILLLKYNLKQSQAATTLWDELESVKNYITIQKFRYGDTFTFTEDLAEDTLQCCVLRFLLQPLVENSILHGFDDFENNYSIHITSKLVDNRLHIQVIDNGSGMNQDEQNLLNSEGLNIEGRFSNIGSHNVRERIKLYFGAEYDLLYTSEPNVQTTAELILPILYDSLTNANSKQA